MRFLVLNHHIKQFAGSEINALQLAMALKKFGMEADLGTFILGNPMAQIAAREGIRVIELLSDHQQTLFEYDVVWAHHAPALAHLMFNKNLPDCRILFSCLSTIVPLEAPPLFHEDIPLFLSHNPVNTRVMVKNGVSESKIFYFPNHVPERYFTVPPKPFPQRPEKIAIVSNHPPEELRTFKSIAEDHQISVDFIGVLDHPVFVDDHLLKKYDLVISIGKTVYYGLVLGIPVYCYDHFGGPGFITPENFFICKDHNFSGRERERKLNGPELFSDIISNYASILGHLEFLRRESGNYFCLEKNLKNLLCQINSLPKIRIKEFREKHSLAERTYNMYIDQIRYSLWLENQCFSSARKEINLLENKPDEKGEPDHPLPERRDSSEGIISQEFSPEACRFSLKSFLRSLFYR